MNTARTLENIALKEKLLRVLRNDSLKDIIKVTENLMKTSANTYNIITKLDYIADETVKEKLVYSRSEWVAAYIIAHEYETLEKLNEIYEISLKKIRYNNKLSEQISKAIFNLHDIIKELVEEIKEIKNDNIYESMIEKLEQVNSVVNYLSDVLGKMGKEKKELYENIELLQENVEKTILSILERL
jgi:DNA polymerase III delta prime subunit